MDENTVIDRLVLFGLTRQEAAIYLCLYRNGELTGYEVAKQTGISRSNVYSALSGLTDKGAAYLIEGSTSKYMAVRIDEFCENKIWNLNQEKEFLITSVPTQKEQEIGYITIEGSRNIWDKMRHMLKDAKLRIYISASFTVIETLKKELLEAAKRGIKIVILTDQELAEKALMENSTCYLCGSRRSNVRLIIDSAYALTGETTGSRDDTCLYTGQKNFIDVFKETLRNEIKLTELQGGETE